jgi:hypothetical protein
MFFISLTITGANLGLHCYDKINFSRLFVALLNCYIAYWFHCCFTPKTIANKFGGKSLFAACGREGRQA